MKMAVERVMIIDWVSEFMLRMTPTSSLFLFLSRELTNAVEKCFLYILV